MSLQEFEIINAGGQNQHITVLEEFKHHYTGETMRNIRIEYHDGCEHPTGGCHTTIVNDTIFEKYYWNCRVPESVPIGYMVYSDGTKERIDKLVKISSGNFAFVTCDGGEYIYNRYIEEDDEVNFHREAHRFFHYSDNSHIWCQIMGIECLEILNPEYDKLFDGE